MADVRFLLWDFGDTLVDEHFLWVRPPGAPGWTDAYRSLAGGEFGTRWNTGTATSDELVSEMASRLEISAKSVRAHIERSCIRIRFFPHAWTAARSRAFPQAIVTVNADVFRELIVPNYRLTEVFDAIIISAEEGTESKADLCEVAMARLGCVDPAEALLLDNIEANVDEWRSRGGAAYWFRGDEEFASAFEAGGWNGIASGDS